MESLQWKKIGYLGLGMALSALALLISLEGIDNQRGAEKAAAATTSTVLQAQIPEYVTYSPVVDGGATYRVSDAAVTVHRDKDILTPDGLAYSDTDLAGEMKPGVYVTGPLVSGCEYSLWRLNEDERQVQIGRDFIASGRMIVHINDVEPDGFSSTENCGPWSAWSKLAQSLTVASDGDYWIGDLRAGEWEVGDGCYWEKVIDFRGNQLTDVVSSGVKGSKLVVDDEGHSVRIRGCVTPMRWLD